MPHGLTAMAAVAGLAPSHSGLSCTQELSVKISALSIYTIDSGEVRKPTGAGNAIWAAGPYGAASSHAWSLQKAGRPGPGGPGAGRQVPSLPVYADPPCPPRAVMEARGFLQACKGWRLASRLPHYRWICPGIGVCEGCSGAPLRGTEPRGAPSAALGVGAWMSMPSRASSAALAVSATVPRGC
jgi:hypothetical protein